MYIEFVVPAGWRAYRASALSKEIEAWAARYQIPYKIKIVKYTYRVILTDPEHYTMFGLTWDPSGKKAGLLNIDLLNQ